MSGKALTNKQRVFVTEYLKCWNATEAARRAGYAKKYLHTNASKLLQNTTISEAIEAKKTELMMSADEALIRLTEQARGDIGLFSGIKSGGDLAHHDQSRIVKKFKKRIIMGNGETEVAHIELELYDAQSALRDIGKHHGLFPDKIEIIQQELDKALNILKENLPQDEYERVLSVLASAGG